MNIGVVFLEYARHKGVERISAEIADRVAGHGHTVVYYCAGWKDVRQSKVRFHRVPTIGFLNSARLLSFAVAAKSTVRRYHHDVTHSYGNVIGCDVITAQSCHRAGIEAAKQYIPNSKGSGWNFGIADRIRLSLEHENFAKQKFKKVIAASTRIRRELIQYYNVPAGDIVVIPNGVDVVAFDTGQKGRHRSEVREHLRIPADAFVAVFVGHEFARKGLDALMQALPILNEEDVYLLVCGGDRSSRYEQLGRTLGVLDRIRFVGSQSGIERYYAAADVFVFPTLYEPFGLVITEAMASGLPAIVSSTAGAAEDIIENGKDGLLLSDPRDAQEIAAKMRTLLNDPSLRQQIGGRAREKARRYDWEECARSVINVYEEVVRCSPSARTVQ